MERFRPRKKRHKHIFDFICDLGKAATGAREYYGAHLGPLSQLHHGVSGDVYAVDSRTLFLKNFNYDGEGPGKLFVLTFLTLSPINGSKCDRID